LANEVDFTDYKATLQAFNIDDSNITRITLNK
jgi:hypothetical protein